MSHFCFQERALPRLKGPKLSVFVCLVPHMDREGTTALGIERTMRETGLSRGAVCSALEGLASPSLDLIARVPCPQSQDSWGFMRRATNYRIWGYARFGPRPAPALYDEDVVM